ncbi:21 kDa protein-like [Impatiens glandulifera]|uniref:21 kDa protein-like n=1 Tax=Impatiens glandulifera TaxID=253017 RepID=UPI001FB06C31|nr:21 kDa protein-like [Impatiens glandulifera]
MPKLSLYFFPLLSFYLILLASTSVTSVDFPNTDFIKTACKSTRYQQLCFQSLSSYASSIKQDEKQLTQVALTVSLDNAKSLSTFVSNMVKTSGLKRKEYQALKDCVDNLEDAVNQLTQSIEEMGRATTNDFAWRMGNVQTWVSTALTNENICANGFSGGTMGGNVKVGVTKRVLDLSRVTSNALALVYRFVDKHKGHMP